MNNDEKLHRVSEFSGLSLEEMEALPDSDLEKLVQIYDLIQQLDRE